MCCKLKYKNSHELSVNEDISDDFETLTFQSLHMEPIRFNPILNREVFTVVNIDIQADKPTALKAKVDSGAQGDALTLRLYKQMFPQNIKADGTPKADALEKSRSSIISYGGHDVKHYGICSIPCEYEGRRATAKFFVTEDSGKAIIGLPTAMVLNLITINCSTINPTYMDSQHYFKDKQDLYQQFPDVFTGGGEVHRTVPYHSRSISASCGAPSIACAHSP